jgi:saccharopine dehydrogenase (NAD+, L-lysine forming)
VATRAPHATRSDRIVQWDLAETAAGGPFSALLASEIFVNCIYLSQPIPPFLTTAVLAQGGALSVVVDVSCDITNPHNPLPIYNTATTFRQPVLRVPKHSGRCAPLWVGGCVRALGC